MDWEALSLVFVGGLLTVGGGFIGQWWSGRQAFAREKRDRDHEQRVWARQLRYEAHIRFLTEFENRFNDVIKFETEGWPNHGAELPEDFLVPVYDRLTMLRTVGDQSTIDAAKGALSALSGYAYGPAKPPEVEKARDLYLVAMREEFGLDPIRPGGEIDTPAE